MTLGRVLSGRAESKHILTRVLCLVGTGVPAVDFWPGNGVAAFDFGYLSGDAGVHLTVEMAGFFFGFP